jgi:hypothetical protein
MKYYKIIILIIFLIVCTTVFILKDKIFNTQANQISQTEIKESWKEYRNEKIGFSFSYPADWYTHNENSNYALISVSPIGPDDKRLASDVGLITSFDVKILSEKSIEDHIKPFKNNPLFQPFTTSNIELDNGVIIPTISYFNPIGTDRIEAFVKLDNGDILQIAHSIPVDETYMKILRSFQW